MDYNFYLNKFQNAAAQLNQELLDKKQLEVKVGIILDSVYLKLYKKQWTNDSIDPMNSPSRIFFSIWINDKMIKDQKLSYNIHAFKLRHLKGYAISSRDFADNFRTSFKNFQNNWKNVSVKFGPLTLMEGWEPTDSNNVEHTVTKLACNFLEIDHLIDQTLQRFKHRK